MNLDMAVGKLASAISDLLEVSSSTIEKRVSLLKHLHTSLGEIIKKAE